MNVDWSDWFEHDGKPCPILWRLCQIEFENPVSLRTHDCNPFSERGLQPDGTWIGIAEPARCWDWAEADEWGIEKVIRYRVRKPRAMKRIEALLEDLPSEVPA